MGQMSCIHCTLECETNLTLDKLRTSIISELSTKLLADRLQKNIIPILGKKNSMGSSRVEPHNIVCVGPLSTLTYSTSTRKNLTF